MKRAVFIVLLLISCLSATAAEFKSAGTFIFRDILSATNGLYTGSTNVEQYLADLNGGIAGAGAVFWLKTSSNATTFNGITATSATNWTVSSASLLAAHTNTFSSVASGTYIDTFVSDRTFTAVAGGNATVEVWLYRGASGTATVAAEVYLYDTTTSTEVYEFTPSPAAQTITATKAKYVYTIPLTPYTTNNALRALFKLKAVTTTSTPTINVASGTNDLSFASFPLPSSEYVLKSGDTISGSLIVTNAVTANSGVFTNGLTTGTTNVAQAIAGKQDSSVNLTAVSGLPTTAGFVLSSDGTRITNTATVTATTFNGVTANIGTAVITNNLSAVIGTGATYADMNVASASDSVAGAIAFAYATNGAASRHKSHVHWLPNFSGGNQTLSIPSGWKTNVFSPVPANLTNGTITKMYVDSFAATGDAANQTNVTVSFEYFK